MGFSKDIIELSRRAAGVFEFLTRETRNEIRPEIEKAKSFDDLPKWVQDIIIEAEKKQ